MSLSYLKIRYVCENKIYTREILLIDISNLLWFIVGEEFGHLICEDYNMLNLYTIVWALEFSVRMEFLYRLAANISYL